MVIDWTNIIVAAISVLTGGGLWEAIKQKQSKKKTPYDMVIELLNEQKKFFCEKDAELRKEKQDSAEKSYVIAQSRHCEIIRLHPDKQCPIDLANDSRLQSKCETCKNSECENNSAR